VIKKSLLEAYHRHYDLTWTEFDNPTVQMTEKLIPITLEQVEWAEQFFPTIEENYPGWQEWRDYIANLLATDGGLTGEESHHSEPERPASHPLLLPWMKCQRMADWPIFDPSVDVEPNRQAKPEAHRLWRFKHYLNEMTAAETLGSIMWMLPE